MSLYQKLKDNFGGVCLHLVAFDREVYTYILEELDRLCLHFAERAEYYAGDIARVHQKTRLKGLEAIATALSEGLKYNENGSICFSFNDVSRAANEIYPRTQQESSVKANIKDVIGRISVKEHFKWNIEKLAVFYKKIDEVEYGYIIPSSRIR